MQLQLRLKGPFSPAPAPRTPASLTARSVPLLGKVPWE